ncbi:24919_t:CDS:2, partial [Gigaspora margarita]
ITTIVKSESNNPTKILFLKIKAFIPVDKDVEYYIDPFEIGDVVYIREKFIAYKSYYMVTATSIKVTDLEFDNMSAIGIGITITGQTTQTAKTVDGNIVLDFFVKERISEKEPANFWVEVRHKINNTYLANRTNAINQKICSTTALLVGTMNYLRPISNSNEEKHILVLEEISLLSISILQTALNSNPIPSSTKQTPSGQETQDQNNQTDREFN